MNLNINALNDNLIVKELYNDLVVNGIATVYDTDSPYMLCKIIKASDTARTNLDITEDDILVIKRYAKEEFIGDLYFISWKDVRCKMSSEEYNLLITSGLNI